MFQNVLSFKILFHFNNFQVMSYSLGKMTPTLKILFEANMTSNVVDGQHFTDPVTCSHKIHKINYPMILVICISPMAFPCENKNTTSSSLRLTCALHSMTHLQLLETDQKKPSPSRFHNYFCKPLAQQTEVLETSVPITRLVCRYP